MRHEPFDIASIDIRSLNAAQRNALKRHLVRRAHAARNQTIRRSSAGVVSLLRRALPVIRTAFDRLRAGYRRGRQRREGLAQLRAMSDRELRDIGLSRSQIRAAAFDRHDPASRDGPR
jgi:uncharacterized protein YjiS (DUF1127 family)